MVEFTREADYYTSLQQWEDDYETQVVDYIVRGCENTYVASLLDNNSISEVKQTVISTRPTHGER